MASIDDVEKIREFSPSSKPSRLRTLPSKRSGKAGCSPQQPNIRTDPAVAGGVRATQGASNTTSAGEETDDQRTAKELP